MPVFLGESPWFGGHACAPHTVFPKSTRLGSLYVGQTSALRAFFDRGGVIYEAHCAKVRVRYASRHTDLPSSPLQRFVPGIDLKYCVKATELNQNLSFGQAQIRHKYG